MFRVFLDLQPFRVSVWDLISLNVFRITSLAGARLSDVGTEAFREKLGQLENRLPREEPLLYFAWELLCKPVLVCNPPKLFVRSFKFFYVSVLFLLGVKSYGVSFSLVCEREKCGCVQILRKIWLLLGAA